MRTPLLARLPGLAMVALSAFGGVASPTDHSYSFRAALTGDVRAAMSGSATFDWGSATAGTLPVFILDLGTDSLEGAVLFTRTSGTRLSVGSYGVSDLRGGSDALEAVVRLGRADGPERVFRAQAGTLTITSVSDNVITGLFALQATGFPAARPDRDSQRVFVSGSFAAKAED